MTGALKIGVTGWIASAGGTSAHSRVASWMRFEKQVPANGLGANAELSGPPYSAPDPHRQVGQKQQTLGDQGSEALCGP